MVDLLRHGEVAAAGWAFRGRTDVPLSDTGWQQMQRLAASLAPCDHIAASPLTRCLKFAEAMRDAWQASLVILPDMREMDFGAWEDRSFDELQAEHGALLQRFWASPEGMRPPGGELFDDFAERVISCWRSWLADASGAHRLLVAHGGVIRVLLAHLLQMPMRALWRLHLPHASWSRVSLCAGHPPRLLFVNREPR